MIGYVTIGTNNFDNALRFYDQLMAILDEKRLWTTDTMAAWGLSRDEPSLCVTEPYDGALATVGNGVMVALKASSREQVDALHSRAIELGGKDEGAPGARGTHGFYGGYFRDLDGNKFNAYIPATSA